MPQLLKSPVRRKQLARLIARPSSPVLRKVSLTELSMLTPFAIHQSPEAKWIGVLQFIRQRGFR